MRDWKSLIEQQLAKLKLSESKREEVITELAAHLEDLSEDAKQHGPCDTLPTADDLYEMTDWMVLARRIQKSKRDGYALNSRSKTFWLPALATLGAVEISSAILMRSPLNERLLSMGVKPSLAYLLALAVFGALGAYLSRRNCGGRATRIAAGIFPPVVTLCIFVVIFSVNAVSGHRAFVGSHLLRNWISVLIALFAPCLASLMGALLFMRNTEIRKSSDQSNGRNGRDELCGNS
jgi:hypothetical protein